MATFVPSLSLLNVSPPLFSTLVPNLACNSRHFCPVAPIWNPRYQNSVLLLDSPLRKPSIMWDSIVESLLRYTAVRRKAIPLLLHPSFQKLLLYTENLARIAQTRIFIHTSEFESESDHSFSFWSTTDQASANSPMRLTPSTDHCHKCFAKSLFESRVYLVTFTPACFSNSARICFSSSLTAT